MYLFLLLPSWSLPLKILGSSALPPPDGLLSVAQSQNHTSKHISLPFSKPPLSLLLPSFSYKSALTLISEHLHPGCTLFLTSPMHCTLLWMVDHRYLDSSSPYYLYSMVHLSTCLLLIRTRMLSFFYWLSFLFSTQRTSTSLWSLPDHKNHKITMSSANIVIHLSIWRHTNMVHSSSKHPLLVMLPFNVWKSVCILSNSVLVYFLAIFCLFYPELALNAVLSVFIGF